MFKLKINLDEWDDFITIVENDRGNWKIVPQDVAGLTIFEGYEGENTLIITTMPMQSMIWDMVGVHSMVDNYIKVSHHSGKRPQEILDLIIEELDIQDNLELILKNIKDK